MRGNGSRNTYCHPNNDPHRIVSELPAMVFYRRAGGVAVDLYTPSQAKLVVAENVPLTIKQETDYPNSGQVRLLLEPGVPARFPLQLRIPAWAQGAAVSVNGERAAGPVQAGTFFALDRQWKRGDEVTLEDENRVGETAGNRGA